MLEEMVGYQSIIAFLALFLFIYIPKVRTETFDRKEFSRNDQIEWHSQMNGCNLLWIAAVHC
ncbi:hypothetical protein [Sporosarcina ureae]|uniref:hypothetical protein n=2 Tax=Sporosarcina ureae TaxID=1571 RepID=UPI00048E3414|nr:hypothetical protein [Sporosarcina ureae]